MPSSRTWRASIKLLRGRLIRMAVQSKLAPRARGHVLAERKRLPADAVWRDDFVNEMIKFGTESLPTRSTPLRNFSIMRLGSWVSEVLARGPGGD